MDGMNDERLLGPESKSWACNNLRQPKWTVIKKARLEESLTHAECAPVEADF